MNPKDYEESPRPMKVEDEVAENGIKYSNIVAKLILASIIGTVGLATAFANHMMDEAINLKTEFKVEIKEFKVDVVNQMKKTNETLGEVRDGIYKLSAGQQVLREQVNGLDRRVSIVEETLREK